MEAEYQRGLTGCFMILKTEEGHEQDSWQARILSVNQIEGLLPMTEEHIDNRQQFRYDITSLQPFDVFCSSRHVREEDLRKLFTGILGTLRTLEDYLLEGEHLLLDPQYLYVSWEDCRMCAPYHPYYRASVRESLRTLTEYILRKIGTEDQAAVILACRFLHALETEYLQIPDLMKVLQKEEVSAFEGYEEPEITERQKADIAPGFPGKEDRRIESRSGERKMKAIEWQDGFDLSGMTGMDGVDEILGYREAGKADRQRTGRLAPHLPERATLLTALILTPAAGVIYLLLHLQTIVVMNRTEAVLAAAALAGGVLLCTISSAMYRKKKTSGQKKSSIQTKAGNAQTKA
ncbi:MAG: DUF6382 domain-containing protein, partial [Lachnospiraceae bacterium]|nr:DUF6382 domain-containing protein [Lachnospiraceae bacterium]